MDQGGIEERKLVTVLFADLVDSTALAESIDPERLRRLLEAYFRAMAEVIERWGGTIQKYIGDAIMAVFGVPAVRENDAERGLRAAMAMLERLDSLNDELEARHGVRLSVRIGVNTGDVIAPAGELGTALIVAGDAVNVAARLQAAASPNGILAGPRTHDAARTAIEFGDPIDLALKGKAEVVRAWHVLGARAEPVRGIPGLRAPMVGRDPELATLKALLDEAIERGEPRLALVYGPPGIGKSRLVAEVAAAAAGAATPARILRGRSLDAGQGGTYWALAEILRSMAGGAAPDLLREAAAGPLAALGLDEGEVARTLRALALTAGLEPEDDAEELTPERVSQELQLAWSRLASALALGGPLVVVLEDLHWAGDPLLEVLTAIVTRSTGPILVLGTARPELIDRKPGFLQARDDTASVTLRPLSDAASGQLIEGLLEIADLPAALRSELVAKAEGNPFFLEEMLRRLIDEGAIVEEDGRWRATAAATTVRLPDSIHGLVAARIDGLAAPAKALLREASVVGRSFWVPAIEASVGGPEAAAGSVRELEARGLVTVRPTSSLGSIVEYQFRHVLIRDVAYGSVPKSRRGRSHAAIATWLEDAAGERKPAFAEAIADHYRAALLGEDADLAWLDDPAEREAVRTRAVAALVDAGDGARRVFALARAVELHEAALQLVASPAERARATEALGDDHFHAFQPLPALEQYDAALDQAKAEGRISDVPRLVMKTAQVLIFRSASDGTLRPLDVIDALLDSGLAANPEPTIRAHLLAMSGQLRVMYTSVGAEDPRPSAVRRAATQEALAVATELDDPVLLIDVLQGAIALGYETDDVAGNAELAERLLALEARTSDPEQRIRIISNVVGVLADYGHPALDLYGLSQRAISIPATSRHSRLHTTAIHLWVAYRAGTWVDVEPILQEHLRDSEIEGISCPVIRGGVSSAAAIAGWQGRDDLAGAARARVEPTYMTEKFYAGSPINALRAAGDLDRARVVALDMFERIKAPWWDDVVAPAIDLAVELGQERGDWSLVERMVALGRRRAAVMMLMQPTCDRAQGAFLVAHGDPAGGRRLLEPAMAEFERLQLPFEVARTARLLAAAAEPDDAAAAALLARAVSIEADLGMQAQAAPGESPRGASPTT